MFEQKRIWDVTKPGSNCSCSRINEIENVLLSFKTTLEGVVETWT